MKKPNNIQVGDVLVLGRHRLLVVSVKGTDVTLQLIKPPPSKLADLATVQRSRKDRS